MRQAAEHLAAAGGLPVAVRYLRRAAELPPSNTSWYMGLSNGSAGLCAPRRRCCPLGRGKAPCGPPGVVLLERSF